MALNYNSGIGNTWWKNTTESKGTLSTNLLTFDKMRMLYEKISRYEVEMANTEWLNNRVEEVCIKGRL